MSKHKRISPSALQDTLQEIFQEYSDTVISAMPEITKEVGKEGVKILKKNTEAAGIKGTIYKNSFKYKFVAVSSINQKVILYSPRYYRLTHLLEHGHVIKYKRGGTVINTGRKTRAFPHWELSEEEAAELLEEKIKEKVEALN